MIARKRWLLLLLYLALLAASHVRRALQEPPVPPQPVRTVRVDAVDVGGGPSDRQVDLAYRVWEPQGPGGDTTPLILLHGSPGSSRDFLDLAPAVAEDRRILAPDLPGFGASTRDVPNYSILAHADYALQLLDALGIETADLLGFSMGGGVALEVARLAPGRVRSLTLLSSIGVQELELLGNYQLNHALHGLQLAGLWAVHEAVPHFGALDDGMLSVEYARNFFDTDQRPLRRTLESFGAPTLIVHGDEDSLVPVAAAHEHHRIVPQSRLHLLAGNHFMVFSRGDELAESISAFLRDVASGRAPRRQDADPSRLEAAARPYETVGRQPASGFSLAVVMLLLAAATLISEDLACIGAGLLVAHGSLAFGPAVTACLVGIVAGDIGLYWAGRLIGARALRYAPLKWMLSEDKVAESSAWLEKRGIYVILLTRFVPGTRLPTYFTAGMLKAGFWRFTGFFLAASLVWTPLLVGVASLVGERAFDYFEWFQEHALLGLAVIAVLVWIFARLVPALATWRGRRLAYGRWRRLKRWEYWPWWILYLPVAAWIAGLGLRYRSLSLFTLANPGLPAGGFVGESKGDLLTQMPEDVVPPFHRLEADAGSEERVATVRGLLDTGALSLPLVLKPDSGERGLGVQLCRSWEEIEAYIRANGRRTLVQSFVSGEEFGLFYARHPEDGQGGVPSITLKRLPTVTGDGRSTLEHLILENDRTVCYAHPLLAHAADRLATIPAAGERVSLGDLGTHSRGATFLDGNHLVTPELERAVDRVAQSVDGFYFGRFDVRAPSEEHLRRGEGLQILELNGVTSEEAHMYDPKHGVFYAWRTLMTQWSNAFAIGAVHRGRGLRPAGTARILREVVRYQRTKCSLRFGP